MKLSLNSTARSLVIFTIISLIIAATPGTVFGQPQSVLLIHDPARTGSVMDCNGIGEALAEIGIVHQIVDIAQLRGSSWPLASTSLITACHLNLQAADATALDQWIGSGGGLLATGSTAIGLEATLGLNGVFPASAKENTEVRFVEDHPASTGSWWSGAITTTPPMPAVEIPSIVQLYYLDNNWPAFNAEVADGLVMARWRDSSDDWSLPDHDPAVIAHHHGSGRTVYSAALPGVYSSWDWPHAWRGVIVSAIEWLADDQPLVELGLWPYAHQAALAWTGDTERPEMVTAVPALLAIFTELGLTRFGTFYVVGKAGGDGNTLGAAEHPEVVQAIAAAGSEVGGHGDIHSAFYGQSLATQKTRISTMLDILDPLLAPYGERVRGFRAPYLSQDLKTFSALAELGLDYDAGEADVWSETTLPHELGGVWQLPPTMPMDWHLFIEHGLSEADALEIFSDKLDYVVSRRGLFSWLHHPWVIEPHLELVRALLTHARDRGIIWMARQDDILDWWQSRAAITIDSVERDGAILRVALNNPSDNRDLDGISIWVRMPAGSGNDWSASAGQVPVPLLIRTHADAPHAVAILPQLAAGQEIELEIRLGDRLFRDRFERIQHPVFSPTSY